LVDSIGRAPKQPSDALDRVNPLVANATSERRGRLAADN
jgi:hypothetical protein